MTKDEVMQMALQKMEYMLRNGEWYEPEKAIEALRTALAQPEKITRSLTDELMDCVDRLGSESDTVDPRVWEHLLVYAPKQHKALAQPEPVACRFYDGGMWCYVDHLTDLPQDKFEPLYPAPLQRKWQGLTDDERLMCLSSDVDQAIANTEAKLKEKNT